ncbi:MAG: hypothetical protein ACNS63_05590 [Candidatus Nitrospinota bacterium M3_3B_026]
MRPKHLLPLFILIAAACGGGGGNGAAQDNGGGGGASAWTFTPDNVDFGITDVVSPEAVTLPGGSVRLYTTGVGGMGVYTAADGLSFQRNDASPPEGSDPTLIELPGGSWRMYYVGGGEEIMTATSPDGLTFTPEAATGIKNTTGTQAWGVPDTIMAPDGRVRIFWVDSETGSLEVIKSAVAADGVSFTEEAGYRTTGGFVDPYILKAEDGGWVGLFATGPGQPPQKIYVGTSDDGLTWSVETSPVIEESGGGNALDPTAVELPGGSYRVYYIATAGSDPFGEHFLKSGVLAPR